MARFALAISLIVQSGCTIVQMRKDNADTQTRIDAKQQELSGLQATQTQLAAESARLDSDLRQHEVNARELRARLDELIRVNAAAPSASPQQAAVKQDRQDQLQEIRKRAAALEENSDLSDEEKRARLEALRVKTAQLLQLLMVG